jgi:serine/threonine protein kinase
MFYVKEFPLGTLSQAFQKEVRTFEALGRTQFALEMTEWSESESVGTIIFRSSGMIQLNVAAPTGKANLLKLAENLNTCIEMLHSAGLLHRNINPCAVFYDTHMNVRLAGFEHSARYEEVKKNENWDKEEDYAAPETEHGESIQAVDMWSFGAVMYKAIFGSAPFDSKEQRMTGQFVQGDDKQWNVLFKRLFTIRPEIRANAKDVSCLLTATVPKSPKHKGMLQSIFRTSTRSWVSKLTKDNDTPFLGYLVDKLITKELNKPYKIHKFYNALSKRSFDKPRVAFKCLALLHKYISVPGSQDKLDQAIDVLDTVINAWNSSANKHNQKYGSTTSKELITEYANILKEKCRIHIELNISRDWKITFHPTPSIFSPLLSHFFSLSRFSSSFFRLALFNDLSADILSSLLSDEFSLSILLSSEISSFPSESLVSSFKSQDSANCGFIHEVFQRFPYVDVHFSQCSARPEHAEISSPVDMSLSEASSRSSLTVEADVSGSSESDDFAISAATELDIEVLVGQGASASVYRGRYRDRVVAVKMMKTNLSKTGFIKEFNREVHTLSHLHHPNLVSFVGATSGDRCCIVTEFCAGGTLFSLLHEKKNSVKLSWAQRLKMAQDVAAGMAYLHSATPPMIHRDLKSLNLLLSEEVRGAKDCPVVKITDFGVTRPADTGLMTGHIGTCHWMAPELLRNEQYGLPSDVYSFGIVLWEILARETPYQGLQAAQIPVLVAVHKRRPDLDAIARSCPKELKAVMAMCWDDDPARRPSFGEVVKMLACISC